MIDKNTIHQNTHLPLLVFVHGAWHNYQCWTNTLLPFFEQQGFECYALRLRGHEQNRTKKISNTYRIYNYVQDLEQYLSTIDRPVILIGHSMGGFIVQHFLVKNPERVQKVILLATAPPRPIVDIFLRVCLKYPLAVLKSAFTLNFYHLVSNKNRVKEIFYTANITQEVFDEQFEELQAESWLAILGMMLFEMPKKPSKKIPTLIIGGEKDSLFSPNTMQFTAKRYQADCFILKDKAHNFFLQENWEESAQIMLEWICKDKE